MNTKSENMGYNGLIGDLRQKLKDLVQKIAPSVHNYEFLKSKNLFKI